MNTAIDASASREKQQAIENLRKELHKIYWDLVGKEPDPEVVRAEAEALVTKYGPIASLKEMLV
jgi:hypothetical protein